MSRTETPTGPLAGPSLAVDEARLLDRACDQFEAAWRAGRRPDVGAAVADLPEPVRAAAVRELVQLDAFYRRRAGEEPAAADYSARFPDLDAGGLAAALAGEAGEAGEAGGAGGTSTLIGPYKLLQVIGEGGMGSVWMAEQTHPVRRKVALKLIKAGMDSRQVVARFEAERQALALMDHPNIAKVFDAGTTDAGRPYFVMELVKGVPITRYCDEARLTPRQRLELFVPVCQAVQHAHQKGIIHRDLKPSNVLVALHDGRPVPKVIDFGLAKATHQALTDRTLFTEFGAVVGTVEYMSPEQAELNQLDVDTRSDVYALGVLLYQLLTGTTPLDRKRLVGAAIGEVLRRIREEEPPAPSTRLSQSGDALPGVAAVRGTEPVRLTRLVRGELDWVAMKALEKDRSRRYESAGGLAHDVERYLRDEPVEAGPPGAAYRLRKFVRRHRGPVRAAAAIAVLLVAGLVGTTWGWLAAANARDAEAWERGRAERAEAEARTDRDAAVEQKRRADEQAAIATAVSDFLKKDLILQADSSAQADQGFPADPNLTVREALDRAAARIGERFQDQPLVEAAIRQAIAEAYWGVGEFERSLPHFERVLALREAHLGADHLDTIDALRGVAEAHRRAGRTAHALPMLERALAAERARPTPNEDALLATMNGLAGAYSATGRSRDALALWEEVARRRRVLSGPDHRDTLAAVHNLATAYVGAGRTEDGIALHEEVLRLKEAKLRPDHPDTLRTRASLAVAYVTAGRRLDEAVALQEGVWRARKAQLAPDHPDVLSSTNLVAWTYQETGRPADAIPLHEATRAGRTARLGADHPDTLTSVHNLAWAHADVGRVGDAIPLFEDALKRREAKLGTDNPSTKSTRSHLAVMRKLPPQSAPYAARLSLAAGAQERGDLKAAETRGRMVVTARRRLMGADHPDLAGALVFLGRTQLLSRKFVEAESVTREALAILQKARPDEAPTAGAASLLGGALLGQQRYAEAEPMLREGYEGMKSREAQIPAAHKGRLTEALERLVQLYDAWGKPDEATKWRRELEARRPSGPKVDPDTPKRPAGSESG